MTTVLEEGVLLLSFGLIHLFALARLHFALKSLVAAVTAKRMSVLTAYLTYAAVRTSTIRWTLLAVMGIGGVLAFFGVEISALDTAAVLLFPFPPFDVSFYLLTLAVLFTLGTCYFSITVLVDYEVMRAFEGTSLTKKSVCLYKLKQGCTEWIVPVLFLQAVIVFRTYQGTTLPIFIPLVRSMFASLFYLYGALLVVGREPITSLSQSRWAALRPRLLLWSTVAGVTFSEVFVARDIQVGATGVRVVGARSRTLVISERLLRSTEWRQQDAIAGYLAGLARQNYTRTTFIRITAGLSLPVLFLAVYTLLGTSVLAWLVLPVMLLFVLLRRAVTVRGIVGLQVNADRMSAYLTGDPLAMMVVLHLIEALNGRSPVRRGMLSQRLTYTRINALDALVQQPWPRAPFAEMPVESVISVTVGTHVLTSPCTTVAKGQQPVPVPPLPYVPL